MVRWPDRVQHSLSFAIEAIEKDEDEALPAKAIHAKDDSREEPVSKVCFLSSTKRRPFLAVDLLVENGSIEKNRTATSFAVSTAITTTRQSQTATRLPSKG